MLNKADAEVEKMNEYTGNNNLNKVIRGKWEEEKAMMIEMTEIVSLDSKQVIIALGVAFALGYIAHHKEVNKKFSVGCGEPV